MAFSPELFRKRAKEKEVPPKEIERRIEYATYLSDRGYPVIFTTKHLAAMIGIDNKRLWHILQDTSIHYTYFRVLRKRMPTPSIAREIMAPSKELKYIQKWILINILEYLPLHSKAMAYRQGVSVKHHAEIHARAKYLMKVDIAKFFDTISEARVAGVFMAIGYSKPLARDMAKLCTTIHQKDYWSAIDPEQRNRLASVVNFNSPTLSQGSPASPALSNFILGRLDTRLDNMAKKKGFNYSRYADDLAFSADRKAVLPDLSLIREILFDEGFVLNEKKTVVQGRGMKQYLTGLTITDGVHVPKCRRKLINTHLHYAAKYGVRKHLMIRKKKGDPFAESDAYQDWLYGNIQWIRSISPEIGDKMMKKYHQIDWKI